MGNASTSGTSNLFFSRVSADGDLLVQFDALMIVVHSNHVNVRTIWDYWWRGNPADQLPPFHVLRGFDLQSHPERARLSKAKSMINWLLMFGDCDANAISSMVKQRKIVEFDAAFESCFHFLVQSVLGDSTEEETARRRVGDIGFLHFYDLTSQWMKHVSDDNGEDADTSLSSSD